VLHKTLLGPMTPVAEVFKEECLDNKEYWQNELKSLGIEPRRQNELNDKEELQALAEILKEVYFQDYKIAYSSNTNGNNNNKIAAASPANSAASEKRE
jgi:hypothetical protein